MQQSVPATPSSPKLTYLPGLTGIRAIAAFMVYLVHFDPFESYKSQPDDIRYFAHRFLQEFGIGVTMFFVLSGFLIALRYGGTVRLTKAWFKRYIINRIARIYPMYFLVTALTFLVLTYDPSYDYMGQYRQFNSFERLVTQFLNFSLLRGFSDNFKYTGVAQGWSLTVEECFYLSAPVFLTGIYIRYRRIFIYPLLLISFGILLTAICSRINIYGFFSNYSFLFSFTFFGRCIEFFIGMALALQIKRSSHPAFTHDNKAKYTALGIAGILLCTLAMTCIDAYTPESYASIIHGILNSLVLPFFICALYVGIIFEKNTLTQFLKSDTFGILGKSSYIFYLIHMGVIHTFIYRHISESSIVAFGLLNILAIILYKGIEEPCHHWIKSLAKTPVKTELA